MHKVGDVLKVTVPYTSTGKEPKCRWFVFLGRLNFTENPRNAYLCTSTTEIDKYKNNKNSTWGEFKAESSCFDEDCLLCLDEIESSFTEDDFVNKFRPKEKGRITDEKLKEIAKKIKNADLAPKIIKDILDSFKLDEIPTN